MQTFSGGFFGWGLREGATWKDLSLEEFIMGKEKFHEGDTGFLALLKKNNGKINRKKFFFRLKLRSSIKT